MSVNQEYVDMENIEAREYYNLSPNKEYCNLSPNKEYVEYLYGKTTPFDNFNKHSNFQVFLKNYKEDCKFFYYLLIVIIVSIIIIITVIIFLHLKPTCN